MFISCCHFKNVVTNDFIKRHLHWLKFKEVREIIQSVETAHKTENECIVKTQFCWIIEVIKTSEILKRKCRLKTCSCALFKINMKFNQKLSHVFLIIHSTSERAHWWQKQKLLIIEKQYSIKSAAHVRILLQNKMLSLTVCE